MPNTSHTHRQSTQPLECSKRCVDTPVQCKEHNELTNRCQCGPWHTYWELLPPISGWSKQLMPACGGCEILMISCLTRWKKVVGKQERHYVQLNHQNHLSQLKKGWALVSNMFDWRVRSACEAHQQQTSHTHRLWHKPLSLLMQHSARLLASSDMLAEVTQRCGYMWTTELNPAWSEAKQFILTRQTASDFLCYSRWFITVTVFSRTRSDGRSLTSRSYLFYFLRWL